MAVNQCAGGFAHPSWLHLLPKDDVLVAEINTPAEHDAGSGLKGLVMEIVMTPAGAGVPSANRISLLQDLVGDGLAETQAAFLKNRHSPFGMALTGSTLYVPNTDAIMAFPYVSGATHIASSSAKTFDLPTGPINHHCTRDIFASRDGRRLFVTVGSNSNVG